MSSAAEVKRLWTLPDMLGIEWADGSSSEFASLWLRDNVREDRDPHSGQRLIDIADLPEDPRIRSAQAGDGAVRVEWEAESRTARFDVEWLLAHAANRSHPRPEFTSRRWLEGARLDAAHDFAWAAFAAARSDRSLRARWLLRLLQDGIAFLSDVPAGEAGILEAAALAGRILETNYGQVFDVRSVPQPENLAYSDLGLGLHTDNPYREPVPGFQALHVLTASPDGGESLFGDGFAIAEHLRAAHPQAFAVLTQTPVPFLYRSKDAELYAERPLIQLTCAGEVSAVHYNSRSIAPLRLGARDAGPFYAAYRRFAGLLRDSRFHLRFRLRDGDTVIFDNQRTLHGRTAFSSARHPRHLRGCYLSRDSVFSEAALLRRETHPETRS
ncbi:MAG TPA: TauD/TfdA family dioxygenase [Steroidobacteraceae bacterium]|nr:TauD/TfdA family dioxygenase [Steroidobacteraceae bacterium]